MFVLCLVSGLSGNQDTFNAFKIFFLEKLHMSVSMDIVRTWCSRNNVFYCWNLSELGRHWSPANSGRLYTALFGDQKAQEEEQYIVHKHNFSGVLFKFVYYVFIIKRSFLKRCRRLLFHFAFQSKILILYCLENYYLQSILLELYTYINVQSYDLHTCILIRLNIKGFAWTSCKYHLNNFLPP